VLKLKSIDADSLASSSVYKQCCVKIVIEERNKCSIKELQHNFIMLIPAGPWYCGRLVGEFYNLQRYLLLEFSGYGCEI
jgi:hypothetical protein